MTATASSLNAALLLAEEDDGDHCTACNGSGEGMHDGTRCQVCRGKGVVYPPRDDDYDDDPD